MPGTPSLLRLNEETLPQFLSLLCSTPGGQGAQRLGIGIPGILAPATVINGKFSELIIDCSTGLIWTDSMSLLLCLPNTSQELIRGWEVAGLGEGPRRHWHQTELGAKPSSAGPLWATHFPSLSLSFLIWKKERENILICLE